MRNLSALGFLQCRLMNVMREDNPEPRRMCLSYDTPFSR